MYHFYRILIFVYKQMSFVNVVIPVSIHFYWPYLSNKYHGKNPGHLFDSKSGMWLYCGNLKIQLKVKSQNSVKGQISNLR